MNSLTRTLNQEKDTVTGALDTFPGAVKVLADQHDQLMDMLRALDKLGAVGTRVVNGTKDNLLEDLRNIRPALHEISRADETIPKALSLLISFPFPIESNNIVHGDYANTKIAFEINLDNLFRNAQGQSPGGGGPGLPGLPGLPELPDLPGLPGLPGGGNGGGGGGGGGGGLGGGLGGLLGRSATTTQDSGMATSMSELLGGPA
jgi:phospholipid/cholesterol/gamma-HCH transport system substrate-binding protein